MQPLFPDDLGSADSRTGHAGQPVLSYGRPPAEARAAMILLHGRGARASDILALAAELGAPDFTFLAPQAAGNAWYPNRFLAPLEENEPWLSSALSVVGELLNQLESWGIPPDRTVLLGFSQGACLALEYAARNPRRYGGLVGLSGGLIGPPSTAWDFPGELGGTPVFLGCGDPDPHIPSGRFYESEAVLAAKGAVVTARLYPGLGHTVNRDELQQIRKLAAALS